MHRILILLVFIIIPFQLRPQVLPKEGSCLNYRIIGFSFTKKQAANEYKIEIALGNYFSEDSFKRNIIISKSYKTNKAIAEVPAFGNIYTWRISYSGKSEKIKTSPYYHFSTILNSRVDTAKMHLNILQPAESYQDAYVAIGTGGVIYDMEGNPVWCVSDSSGLGNNVSDMKFSPQGTITFMTDQTGYEINYDSRVLWQTPLHDTVINDSGPDFYHHEFTRLSNGHYMTIGTEYVWYKTVTTKDSSYFIMTPDRSRHNKYNGVAGIKNKGRFGIIVELDEKGNVVWSWRSSKYLQTSDWINYWPKDTALRFEPHENAFYFDEQHNAIYLSYRQLSRVIKIDYPSGKVLNTFGEIFKPGAAPRGNGLFCNQHSVMCTKNGYLYLFNNNSCNENALPSVVMMQQMAHGRNSMEKVWEYNCSADGHLVGSFPFGGNAIELPDQSMFICMGSDYPKLLIVNRDKKVLWSAILEKKDGAEWSVIKKLYRANIISRKNLERMVWNSEKS